MSEQQQQTNSGSGAAGGSSGSAGDTSGAGGSFMRSRVAQMTETMQGPSMPESQAQPEDNRAALDPRSQQQQQAPAGERRMIELDGNSYDEADVRSAIAERAEAQSRKATLPAGPDGYELKLPADFVPPENVRFEFLPNDPALKAFRDVAAKHGVSQELFSDALAVFASTKMGEAQRNATLRDVNMKQLGVAGPQRVEAVATWLQARSPGGDGKAMANFLRQFPSAPIVKTMENLMKAFSGQGGADFSQSHRAAQEENAGRIPGYENMSFTEKRVHQMAQAAQRPGGYRGGSRNER